MITELLENNVYCTYYCIGLIKMVDYFDFFDSQIQCVHVLMDEDGKNIVEISNQKNEYSEFEDVNNLFDFLAASFAKNHIMDEEIIRDLLSCAYDKEDDIIPSKGGRILLGVDTDNKEDLIGEIFEGTIGIMLQSITDEEFEIKDKSINVQGKQCNTISDLMGICNWDGMPTVAFYTK